jgi:4-amino-4-deoxy-L-arabinose transferase-like glycosyltransferase
MGRWSEVKALFQHPYRALALILLVAGGLRFYWLRTQMFVIEVDGAEYARIAENLLLGNRYVGTMGGPELIFPPLYPILIATLTLVTGNSELAGRWVSLLAGTSLVLVLFAMALRLYGRTAALITALLVACHPFLIESSAVVLTESLYILLLFLGVYWGLRSLDFKGFKDCLLAGLFFGLAYLTRPEAVAYPFILASIMLVAGFLNGKGMKRVALACLLLFTSVGIAGAPYVGFLTYHTGQILLDGKHNLNYTIGQRLNSGLHYRDANWGVSRELVEEGPLVNPSAFITQSPYSKSPGDIVSYIAMSVRRNVRPLYYVMTSRAFGFPILFLLGLIGLFRARWSHERIFREGLLIVLVSFLAVLSLSAHIFAGRFTFAMLPFLLLWAANGSVEIAQWAKDRSSFVASNSPKIGETFVIHFPWLLAVFLLLLSSQGRLGAGIPRFDEREPEAPAKKEAGLWLRKYMQGSNMKIVDILPTLTYYAGGLWVPLPSGESTTVLRYIHKKDPAFIVLSDHLRRSRPSLADWLRKGIPDQRAKLIYQTGTTRGSGLMIYRWSDSSIALRPTLKSDTVAAGSPSQ